MADAPTARTEAARGGTASTSADATRAVAVGVLAVGQVASAALAPLLLDADVGAVSDRYDHLLTPAGYTFAVWGLIYTASLALAVYQALPAQRSRAVHRRTGWPIAGAFAASTIWVPLFLWQELLLAQVVIVALVAFLAVAAARLTGLPTDRVTDALLLRLPVTGYLGWATIATVAGTGTMGRWQPLTVGPDEAVAIAALAVAAVVAALVTLAITAAGGFVALLTWGLVGISVGTTSDRVAGVATGVAAGLVLLVIIRAVRSPSPRAVLVG
jgi:hypothetical protein